MVLEDASSGLKRDRKRLIMEVLAVPAPPTNRDACNQELNIQKELKKLNFAASASNRTDHWVSITGVVRFCMTYVACKTTHMHSRHPYAQD